jgi:hypothetical protein
MLRHVPFGCLALMGLVLHGAPAWAQAKGVFAAPTARDDGVEIARTMVLNPSHTTPLRNQDCVGGGVGVVIENRTGAQQLTFDASGEPCHDAQVLFDGGRPSGQRAADPTIQIRVHDALGTLLNERPGRDRTLETIRAAQGLPAIPEIKVSEDLLRSLSTEPATPGEDPLLRTLNQWQSADGVTAGRVEESTEAGTRTLQRMVRAAEANSSSAAAAQLAAQLRERERTLTETQRRMAETMARSAENRATTQAARDAWATEQNRLVGELESAKARAAQFEALAARLQDENKRKEAAYSDKISTLAGSLKVAEAQADAGRRQLIMQAAAKVAEAQALAEAAKIEAQSQQLAEASRLQAEANALMDKVLMVREEVKDIAPAAGPTMAATLPILEAPVALQAKQRTLPEILNEVLQQAAPHSGAWRAEWQLGAKGESLLNERWSLTAEATIGQIIAALSQQVAAEHGFTLKATPFAQTRVLVISVGEAKKPVANP